MSFFSILDDGWLDSLTLPVVQVSTRRYHIYTGCTCMELLEIKWIPALQEIVFVSFLVLQELIFFREKFMTIQKKNFKYVIQK